MARRLKCVWALLLCAYVLVSAGVLVYLTYTATVNLPNLPDINSVHWWREAGLLKGVHPLAHHRCNDSDVVCDTCCYCYTPSSHILADFGELSQDKLAERKCEKRLPQAIIIGTMKSGTYALRTYLSYHPDIAMAYDESWFWNRDGEHRQGLDRYRELMHYSTPGQVTMEKTPDYYHGEDVPKLIGEELPNAKIIMIMKDPVQRAISHYNFERRRTYANDFPATFQQAVLTEEGTIDANSPYIFGSVYVTFVTRWLQYFPEGRFVALDGDTFLRDPLPQLKYLEKVLGVRPFFDREMLTKDPSSGFWCLAKPIPTCVPQSQPHPPHPKIDHSVLSSLYRYFRPYNEELKNLLKEPSFEWYSR